MKILYTILSSALLCACVSDIETHSKQTATVPDTEKALSLYDIYDAFMGEVESKQFTKTNAEEKRIVVGNYKGGKIQQMLVSDFISSPISMYTGNNNVITISKMTKGEKTFLTLTRLNNYNIDALGSLFVDDLKGFKTSELLCTSKCPDGTTIFMAVVLSSDVKKFGEQKIKEQIK